MNSLNNLQTNPSPLSSGNMRRRTTHEILESCETNPQNANTRISVQSALEILIHNIDGETMTSSQIKCLHRVLYDWWQACNTRVKETKSGSREKIGGTKTLESSTEVVVNLIRDIYSVVSFIIGLDSEQPIIQDGATKRKLIATPVLDLIDLCDREQAKSIIDILKNTARYINETNKGSNQLPEEKITSEIVESILQITIDFFRNKHGIKFYDEHSVKYKVDPTTVRRITGIPAETGTGFSIKTKESVNGCMKHSVGRKASFANCCRGDHGLRNRVDPRISDGNYVRHKNTKIAGKRKEQVRCGSGRVVNNHRNEGSKGPPKSQSDKLRHEIVRHIQKAMHEIDDVVTNSVNKASRLVSSSGQRYQCTMKNNAADCLVGKFPNHSDSNSVNLEKRIKNIDKYFLVNMLNEIVTNYLPLETMLGIVDKCTEDFRNNRNHFKGECSNICDTMSTKKNENLQTSNSSINEFVGDTMTALISEIRSGLDHLAQISAILAPIKNTEKNALVNRKDSAIPLSEPRRLDAPKEYDGIPSEGASISQLKQDNCLEDESGDPIMKEGKSPGKDFVAAAVCDALESKSDIELPKSSHSDNEEPQILPQTETISNPAEDNDSEHQDMTSSRSIKSTKLTESKLSGFSSRLAKGVEFEGDIQVTYDQLAKIIREVLAQLRKKSRSDTPDIFQYSDPSQDDTIVTENEEPLCDRTNMKESNSLDFGDLDGEHISVSQQNSDCVSGLEEVAEQTLQKTIEKIHAGTLSSAELLHIISNLQERRDSKPLVDQVLLRERDRRLSEFQTSVPTQTSSLARFPSPNEDRDQKELCASQMKKDAEINAMQLRNATSPGSPHAKPKSRRTSAGPARRLSSQTSVTSHGRSSLGSVKPPTVDHRLMMVRDFLIGGVHNRARRQSVPCEPYLERVEHEKLIRSHFPFHKEASRAINVTFDNGIIQDSDNSSEAVAENTGNASNLEQENQDVPSSRSCDDTVCSHDHSPGMDAIRTCSSLTHDDMPNREKDTVVQTENDDDVDDLEVGTSDSLTRLQRKISCPISSPRVSSLLSTDKSVNFENDSTSTSNRSGLTRGRSIFSRRFTAPLPFNLKKQVAEANTLSIDESSESLCNCIYDTNKNNMQLTEKFLRIRGKALTDTCDKVSEVSNSTLSEKKHHNSGLLGRSVPNTREHAVDDMVEGSCQAIETSYCERNYETRESSEENTPRSESVPSTETPKGTMVKSISINDDGDGTKAEKRLVGDSDVSTQPTRKRNSVVENFKNLAGILTRKKTSKRSSKSELTVAPIATLSETEYGSNDQTNVKASQGS